jgi:glycosyltransferase involved in cell wall biosynthesis
MSSRKLAIVPAYNEEQSVRGVIGCIRREAPDFDVVVVDDGSTDRTRERAEEAGATVIQHAFNLGIGGAVQSGFQYAMRGGYDVACQVDGDGQHDPAYLPRLYEVLRADAGVDMVCGTRFREGPGYRVPLRRRIGVWIFSVLLSAIVRQKVTDPTSGFRMTNRRGIELFARDYPHDYPEVEAILMTHAHRLRLIEVPVRMNARDSGRSSIGHGDSVYYMARVLLAVLVGLFRSRPAIEPGDEAAVSAQRGI